MSQQLCFQADEDSEISILERSLVPTFGRPKLSDRKVAADDQAARYWQLRARKPCFDSLRKISVLIAKYPIGYSEKMDEATKEAKFLEYCSLVQVTQYQYDDFMEWKREIALEEYVMHQRKELENEQLFFKWVETHDQVEHEYKLARNKAVLYNLDPEMIKQTQKHVVRGYREHKRQVEAERKRKEFQCTIETRIQSAGLTKQFARAEDHNGSSKTIKPQTESENSTKRQEAKNPKSILKRVTLQQLVAERRYGRNFSRKCERLLQSARNHRLRAQLPRQTPSYLPFQHQQLHGRPTPDFHAYQDHSHQRRPLCLRQRYHRKDWQGLHLHQKVYRHHHCQRRHHETQHHLVRLPPFICQYHTQHDRPHNKYHRQKHRQP